MKKSFNIQELLHRKSKPMKPSPCTPRPWFGFRMWEILIFKRFLAAENSNKFQKTRFWKEKSVEDMVTLGPTAQATLVHIENPQEPYFSIHERFCLLNFHAHDWSETNPSNVLTCLTNLWQTHHNLVNYELWKRLK